MSLAIVFTRAKLGIQSPRVCVEIHLSNGLPSFNIVGLPETSVRESKDRVRSAILNSHFEFPARRITVNLAPAEIPKEGSRFDLAIAIGILAASGQIPADELENYEFIGELALSGELRPVEGVLPAALACANSGLKMIIGTGNSLEAALVDRLEVLPAQHLLQVSAHLHGREFLSPQQRSNPVNNQQIVHLGDIIGQGHAKRALEIAAAGFHNLLFFGPPGTGKTMLASRLAGLMPPLNNQQALQVATIHSVAGHGLRNDFSQRPFRAPHHTASAAALVGGGSSPRPGEISLAHHGVLFLDELPEFSRKVLEVLREPMESGEITISRAAAKLTFPARFQLVAAMNPCPCGYLGDNRCNCSPDQVRRYLGKISGPLLDRIDLQVRVANIDNRQLMTRSKNEMDDSTHLLQRISRAQKLQLERQGKLNAQLENREVEALCPFDAMIERELERAIAHFRLSTRGFYRLLRTARTIADLAEAGAPELPHYREALSFRMASDLNI